MLPQFTTQATKQSWLPSRQNQTGSLLGLTPHLHTESKLPGVAQSACPSTSWTSPPFNSSADYEISCYRQVLIPAQFVFSSFAPLGQKPTLQSPVWDPPHPVSWKRPLMHPGTLIYHVYVSGLDTQYLSKVKFIFILLSDFLEEMSLDNSCYSWMLIGAHVH